MRDALRKRINKETPYTVRNIIREEGEKEYLMFFKELGMEQSITKTVEGVWIIKGIDSIFCKNHNEVIAGIMKMHNEEKDLGERAMIIASDTTLKKAVEFLDSFSNMPGHHISGREAREVESITEQLEDLGIMDDEGCWTETVLGNRAQKYSSC